MGLKQDTWREAPYRNLKVVVHIEQSDLAGQHHLDRAGRSLTGHRSLATVNKSQIRFELHQKEELLRVGDL